MGEELEGIFLNEKPVRALVVIRQHEDAVHGSMVSKKIDTTYAHTARTLLELEEKGLIESQKKGRKKILELTDKGEEYADLFIEVLKLSENRSKTEGD